MHIYIYAYMHMYIYILTTNKRKGGGGSLFGIREYTHTRTHARTHARTRTYTHAHAHARTRARAHARARAHVHAHAHAHIYMTVSIYRQKFLYYSWDKRRDFNFHVVNYPDLSGNIPSNQSYGVYTSQLIRFCEINMSFGHFVKDIILLTEKFANQGFLSSKLREKLVIFRDYYFFKWAKSVA